MRLSPALIALLVGCLTFALSIFLESVFLECFHVTVSKVLFMIIQGVMAALLARILNLAIWWQWILLIFPLAVWMTLKLNLSPDLLFGWFLLLVLVYWSVFLTQVPYYPSGDEALEVVAKLIDHEKNLKVAEIGSGLGGLSIKLSKIHPLSSYIGIEIAPLPFLVSLVRSKFLSSKVIFKLGNYEKLDFADFDLVYAYLSPAAMPKLYEQCKAQMKPGSILVSHEFIVPGIKPSNIYQTGNNSKITYTYQMN